VKSLPWLLSICLAVVLTSCGPAAKLRRAERLIAKAEEQGAVWHVDTVKVEIPIPVPQIQTDTIVQVKTGDTVVIEKDRLKVVIRRLPGDTIKVEAECKADTIYKKIAIRVEKTIEVKSWLKWWHLLIAGLVGAGLFALFRR
jgi:hypothetical protein